jgi:hypothetical protein
MKIGRLSVGYITVIVMLVLHLLPVWGFKYFPTQDGASHIYNAYVVKEYHKHENYRLREVYELNATIFPNWTSHASMTALMYVVPPVIAEKIFLTVTVALLPLSLCYLLGAIDRRHVLFSLVGFIFSHHNLLHMGFYNFALSVSLALFTLGYWWKHRHDIQVRQIIVLNVLLVLTYVTHFGSYALLLTAMAVIALFDFVSGTIKDLWRLEPGGLSMSSVWRAIRSQLTPLGTYAGYMLLAHTLGLIYLLRTLQPFNETVPEMEWSTRYFWNMLILVSYTDWHVYVTRPILGVLLIAALATIVHRIWKRQWFTERDVFLLLAILFTVLFFTSPSNQSGGSWVNQRIYIFIFLFLAAWIAAFHKSLRYIFGGALVILSLIHIGRYYYEYAVLQSEISEQVAATKLIKPHSTFVLGDGSGLSEPLGDVKYVNPFHHSPCYYALAAKDVVYLDNYEARFSYFPVNWKSHPSVEDKANADYVLIWHDPGDNKDKDLEKYWEKYNLVHTSRRVKLLELKAK